MVESKELITYHGVEQNAIKRPGDIATVCGEQSRTWAELERARQPACERAAVKALFRERRM